MIVLSERVKVLVLNHVGRIGGAERSLLDIVQCLDRDKFDVVAGVPGPSDLADAMRARGVVVRHIPFRRLRRGANVLRLLLYAISWVRIVAKLLFLIRGEGIGIVHANSSTAQIYGGMAARLSGRTSIWHSRDLTDPAFLIRVLCRLSHMTIAISKSVNNRLLEAVDRKMADKIVTIWNGIDVCHLAATGQDVEAVRRKLGLSPDDRLVGMFAQLVPWKEHVLFLKAAELVLQETGQCVFLIVGADTFEDWPQYVLELKSRSVKGALKDRVVFTGFRSDVAEIMKAVDVVVHPASREPFGRVVAEAMAVGTAVVAIDACGPAELVRNGLDGLLVAAGNAGELATAVVRILDDKELSVRLRSCAQQRAAEFNLTRFTADLNGFYGGVVKSFTV